MSKKKPPILDGGLNFSTKLRLILSKNHKLEQVSKVRAKSHIVEVTSSLV